MAKTMRLTMAQALVGFLTQQHTSLDGVEQPFFGGVFAHLRPRQRRRHRPGAARSAPTGCRCYLPRNEQAMVHTAVGFAKMANRRRTLVCTSSIGPGATNMVTGAAVATINRLAGAVAPGDIFATRGARARAAAARIRLLAGHLGQRLLQAGVALLGSHQPSRAD